MEVDGVSRAVQPQPVQKVEQPEPKEQEAPQRAEENANAEQAAQRPEGRPSLAEA